VRDVARLPKTDLHVHLEGSIRPATLREIAAGHGRPLPLALGSDDRWRFRDFLHFIEQYTEMTRCLGAPADYRRIARELCEDQAAQGVRWCEVTFTVWECGERLGDWSGIVEAVLDGFADGHATTGVECRLVLDCVWGDPLWTAERTLETALRHRSAAGSTDPGVVALGIGGPEGADPHEWYAELFTEAKRAGLRSVPHAGEAQGADSVRRAIEQLHADRIGHGIRSLEDPDVVKLLCDKAIPLEVCPTSNVATGVVAALSAHPLPMLRDAGIRVTLNSDDPTMFESPVAGEYEVARRVFGDDDTALADLAHAGVDASFAPDTHKARWHTEINTWLAAPASRV
jgi:adenosine deaminase